MIRKGTKKDLIIYQKLWDEYFAFDNEGFNDYFFNEAFEDGEHFIIEENNDVISIASMFPLSLRLNNKLIKTDLISGIVTKKEYQKRGYMRILIHKILDILEYRELFTMIEAYNPKLYESFGFEVIYKRKCLVVENGNYRCHYAKQDVKADSLLPLYGGFVKHFNGYKFRTVKDFENIILKANYENAKIMVVGDENDNYGYCIYKEYNNKIKVEEIIYLNKKALETMLAYLKDERKVELHVSAAEKLEKIINAEFKEYEYGLVRVNDWKLLKKLYRVETENIKDIFRGPLWFHEDY